MRAVGNLTVVVLAVACIFLPSLSRAGDATDAFKRAEEHEKKGAFDQAIAAYTEAIRLNPKYAEAFKNRGRSYQAMGAKHYDQAIADNNEAIRLRPTYAAAYNNRATVFHAQGKTDAALADFAEAIRHDPQMPQPRRNRGNLYRDKGEYAKAIDDFAEVIRINPKDADAFGSRGAVHLLRVYLGKVQFQERDKDLDRAVADFSEAILLNPNYAHAYQNRGVAYRFQDKTDAAIADFDSAIRLAPQLAMARTERGFLYSRKQEYAKAISDFTEALRLNPTDAGALVGRAVAHEKKNDHAKVIEDMSAYIKLNAKAPEAFHKRGIANFLLNNTDQAIADFTEAIRLDPKERILTSFYGIADSLWARASAYGLSGKQDQALADYSEFLKLRPNDTRALERRGRIYQAKKDYYRAIGDFSEGVRHDPKNAELTFLLATATDEVRKLRGSPNIQVKSIQLDETIKHVAVKRSPTYKLPANTEKAVEDSVKVIHSVTIADTWKAEAELRGAVKVWIAEVGLAVRGGIEKSTSKNFGVETERKRSVTLKGPTGAKGVCVVWVDCYRTGRATLIVDNVEVILPFEFKEDFDLLPEEAK